MNISRELQILTCSETDHADHCDARVNWHLPLYKPYDELCADQTLQVFHVPEEMIL